MLKGTGGRRYDFILSAEFSAPTLAEPITGPRQFEELCDILRADTIGQDLVVSTPFGRRKLLYCDFTASGRAVKCIEEFVTNKVLPYYGNTHTLATTTASQSTFYRIEARQAIKQSVNATHEDALIFCGSGSTGAIDKFISIMQRSLWDIAPQSNPSDSLAHDGYLREDRWGSYECTLCDIRVASEILYRSHQATEGHQKRCLTVSSTKQKSKTRERLVIFFCDPTAHHSLLLPFRELKASGPVVGQRLTLDFDVIELSLDPNKPHVNIEHLQNALASCKEKCSEYREVIPVVILSAGSNVTGLLTNVSDITALIHRFGGICCWDFAAAAGHVAIDFNPVTQPEARLDVGFFSPHKLLGGPGSSGFLILKKSLLRNAVPSSPGGGVVFFVSNQGHSYIHNLEEREEGGTPHILSDIRAGLVHRFYQQLPIHQISQREHEMLVYVLRHWTMHRRIDILGTHETENRMAILSFMIRYGNTAPEGNGSRGGCACAGPLAQALLGLSKPCALDFERALERSGQEVLRPGFVRISLNFSMSWDDIDVVTQAVLWIAEFGWQLLPAYTFVPETGEWIHRDFRLSDTPRSTEAVAGPGTGSFHSSPPQSAPTVKDPKELPGAVCVLGNAPDGQQLKKDIQRALASLKKPQLEPATHRPSSEPVSELQAIWKRRAVTASDTRNRSASHAGPQELSEVTRVVQRSQEPFSTLNNENKTEETVLATAGRPRLKQFPKSSPPTAPPQQSLPHEASKPALVRCQTTLKGADHPRKSSEFFRQAASMSQDLTRLAFGRKAPSFGRGKKSAELPLSEQPQGTPERPHALTRQCSTAPEKKLATLFSTDNGVDDTAIPKEGSVGVPKQSSFTAKGTKISDSASPLKPALRSHDALVPNDVEQLLAGSRSILDKLYEETNYLKLANGLPGFPEEFIHLVWFALPADAAHSINTATSGKVQDAVPSLLDCAHLLGTQTLASRPQSACFAVRDYTVERQNAEHKSSVTAAIAPEPLSVTPTTSPSDVSSALAEISVSRGNLTDSKGYLKISRHLRHLAGSAIRDFDMIRENDRLLLGLSGGKDSLTLLHILRDAQRRSPVKFELAAATVDPQTPEYNPRPLSAYVESLGIPYHVLSYPIIDLAKTHMKKNSICAFCSRMKRGLLYSCMRKLGYNVLVLGQHLDDMCESFVMSAFHNGKLNTMKAHYVVGEGDLRVCRPLVYTREKALAAFAAKHRLPVIADNCPACFAQPKERHRVKILLAQQEFEHSNVFRNLLQAMKPLLANDTVGCLKGSPAPIQAEDAASAEVLNALQGLLPELHRGRNEDDDFQAEQALTTCGLNDKTCCSKEKA